MQERMTAREAAEAVDGMEEQLLGLKEYFDLESMKAETARIEEQMSAPDFWGDREKADRTFARLREIKGRIEPYRAIQADIEAIRELLALGEDDESILGEICAELERVRGGLAEFEMAVLLSGEHDRGNAIINIHPGAGGTESQDWAEMLLRMYTRYLDEHGFHHRLLDLQPGDEAGIKNATIEITGEFAFGRFKSESGIHRLVRISPFDANHRRHTSFAAVHVYPEIDDNLDVEIDPDEIRVDTYRASGAGGQHVNKVSSAVRITHFPTGIVVQCQNERSQHRNREMAMRVLRSRIYARLLEEEEEKKAKAAGEKKDISWGNQIRSYVFHPYTLVKDHRTGVQTGNLPAVMDGGIDIFIDGYLRWKERNN
ncbi:MAG: peptide chain release factor 2 [Candidatus Krumholzibacteria bacterium]|nr:peptide chain release factor 2 [Candidatus Krumholzibacteria bacterium]